ncbi:MAG: Unknown protein [uncultured Aureispira sp.]|uniref:DUF3127 domain-containing protein n=1 Tax=uncultured Aureispira sp. TaxID=1331704 RepID=A0A6S6TZY5_9BACT|nr:MAG: Unknown protein [uncultured Aureispira sp.]
MSELKLTGKVIAIMEKQQVTDTFAKREFVIETDEQYPQMVKFELTQAKCEDIDNHKIGDEITVHFNVRGRKWTNKEGKDVYFVSVNAWRLEKGEAPPTADAPFPSADAEPPADSFADDLPF